MLPDFFIFGGGLGRGLFLGRVAFSLRSVFTGGLLGGRTGIQFREIEGLACQLVESLLLLLSKDLADFFDGGFAVLLVVLDHLVELSTEFVAVEIRLAVGKSAEEASRTRTTFTIWGHVAVGNGPCCLARLSWTWLRVACSWVSYRPDHWEGLRRQEGPGIPRNWAWRISTMIDFTFLVCAEESFSLPAMSDFATAINPSRCNSIWESRAF